MRHGGAGLNRKCGQVEEHQRIDSFEAPNKFFQLTRCQLLPHEYDGETVRVSDTEIKLAYMENAAGRLIFFICPVCGRRVRFLYLPLLHCRECSNLNYRCQQVTKGSFAELAAIPEKLDLPLPDDFWSEAEEYTLQRPKNMHAVKFARYRERFEKHQARFVARDQRRLFSILKQTTIGREYFKLIREAAENDKK